MSDEERSTYVSVYRGEDGEWRWRRIARNGEIIASGEGYVRRADLLETVEKHVRLPGEQLVIEDDEG